MGLGEARGARGEGDGAGLPDRFFRQAWPASAAPTSSPHPTSSGKADANNCQAGSRRGSNAVDVLVFETDNFLNHLVGQALAAATGASLLFGMEKTRRRTLFLY